MKDMIFHPLEYWITSNKFTKWKIQDSLAITKLMQYSMTFDFQFELLKYQLGKIVGAQSVNKLFPSDEQGYFWGTDSYILSDNDLKKSNLYVKKPIKKNKKKSSSSSSSQKKAKKPNLDQEFVQQFQLPDFQGSGSNCWAVHGNYTQSGKPMVMSDPHLQNGIPNIFIVSQININGSYSFGASTPGIPGSFITKTKSYSIAFTSMLADTADLYFQKLDKQGEKYFYNKKWYPLQKYIEQIEIKNRQPFQLVVFETNHGPLINKQLRGLSLATTMSPRLKQTNTPISLAWVGNLAPIDSFQIGLKFIQNQGSKGYNGVSLSGCFATANGDIGYLGVVKHPNRENIFAGNQIQLGSNPKYNWNGFIPDTQLPYAINPQKGFISCSNQRIGSDHLKHRIGGFGFPRSRAQTQTRELRKMINSGKKISFENMKQLQGSLFDEMAFDMKERLIKIINQYQDSLQLSELYTVSTMVIRQWNGLAQINSIGASIFFIWEQKFWELCFDQYHFKTKNEKTSYFKTYKPDQWLVENLKLWGEQKNLQDQICGINGCIQLVLNSFIDAIEYLKLRFGQDVSLWKWGHLHRMHFAHSFSNSHVMKPFFHTSYAYGGSRRTLNVGVFYSMKFDSVHSANIRMITTLDEQDIIDPKTGGYKHKSYYSINMGISGIKGTKHYKDFLQTHRDQKYMQMNYNQREKIQS